MHVDNFLQDNEEASKHIDLILLRDELQLLNDSFSDTSIQELSSMSKKKI